jgi:UDP-N-acetylglucosamine 2-epimerase (non-hydrolysing)
VIRVLTVVGARPNFMKVAPIHRVMTERGGFETTLVHTGQHYDPWMSDVFFQDLRLSPPAFTLGVGSGTHAEQTARVLLALEPVVVEQRPHVVIVVGDVNSTLAGALTAAKLNVPVAHIEAGLRSRDRTMPEEINRIVTDHLSDLLFVPSRDAIANLREEGIPEERIHFVGNVMIDSMLACMARAEASPVLDELGLDAGRFFLVTLHRPTNVDRSDDLGRAIEALRQVAQLCTTVLVAHPRTLSRLAQSGMDAELREAGVRVTEALGYIDFLKLMRSAIAVITDSGGIQEETTVLGIPCITVRTTTERPITITHGTNRLTGLDVDAVLQAARDAMSGDSAPRMPELWDGRAADRIVIALARRFA